jgi:hypothetical protein
MHCELTIFLIMFAESLNIHDLRSKPESSPCITKVIDIRVDWMAFSLSVYGARKESADLVVW